MAGLAACILLPLLRHLTAPSTCCRRLATAFGLKENPIFLIRFNLSIFFFPKIIQFSFSQTLSLLNPGPAGRMLHREPSQHPWVPRHHPAFTVPVSPTPTRGHPMPPAPQSSALMGNPRASFPPQPSLCDLAVGCGAGTATPDRPHPHLASLRSPLPAAGLPNGLYKHRKRGYFPKRTKEKKKSVRGCFTGSAPSVGQGWWGHGRTLQGQPACHPRGSAWYCYDGKGEKKIQRTGQKRIGAVFKFYPGGQSGFGAAEWVWRQWFALQIAQRAFLKEK